MRQGLKTPIRRLDLVDLALIGAAVVGGLGGLFIAIVKELGDWAYRSSALYFFIAILFLLFRHFVLRSS